MRQRFEVGKIIIGCHCSKTGSTPSTFSSFRWPSFPSGYFGWLASRKEIYDPAWIQWFLIRPHFQFPSFSSNMKTQIVSNFFFISPHEIWNGNYGLRNFSNMVKPGILRYVCIISIEISSSKRIIFLFSIDLIDNSMTLEFVEN